MIQLRHLSVGQQVRFLKFAEQTPLAYRQRLLALGLVPGITIGIQRIAPLGDPIAIKLRGFTLSLRKEEAEGLLFEYI